MNVIACIKRENTMLNYDPHSHAAKYKIITNHIGNCIATVNGTQYRMKKNDILIVPPNTTHIACSEDGFFDFFVAANHLSYDKVYFVNDTNNVVLSLMEMMYTTLLEKDINYKSIADALLDTICCYLDRYVNTNRQFSLSKYPFVQELKNTIIENFTDPTFRLNEAAEKVGYSLDYMRRCFLYETNKTPLQYLTNLRINRAKMLLLQHKTESIISISEQCGFADSFYFSYVFKKHTGMSPTKYRELHAK